MNYLDYPILYTFRRCPYAIRARMALNYSKIDVIQREVSLKNKPQEMLIASAKGTVPVLIVGDGHVIDESLDIMIWALTQSDPDNWLNCEFKTQADNLIKINDGSFKASLNHYKYPQKSEKKDPNYYREEAKEFLNHLNTLLTHSKYLLANHISLADVAIFPFIRQFYGVDPEWFEQSEYSFLKTWLHAFLNSELFLATMKKINL